MVSLEQSWQTMMITGGPLHGHLDHYTVLS
jgi:hypothetical protein